jgi:predicted enzyme related to lactoylglutathione lyase
MNPDVSAFVDDVRATYEAAVASRAEVVHPLTKEDRGVTRFFCRDSSGRVISVGSHS